MDDDAAGQAVGGSSSWPGRFFAQSYRNRGVDRLTYVTDKLLQGGPGKSGVRVTADSLEARTVGFRVNAPRSSVRSVAHSTRKTRGTTGVHSRGGHWLVNGGPDGLVEIVFDPPATTALALSTVFQGRTVHSLVLSLEDPDVFIAAMQASE